VEPERSCHPEQQLTRRATEGRPPRLTGELTGGRNQEGSLQRLVGRRRICRTERQEVLRELCPGFVHDQDADARAVAAVPRHHLPNRIPAGRRDNGVGDVTGDERPPSSTRGLLSGSAGADATATTGSSTRTESNNTSAWRLASPFFSRRTLGCGQACSWPNLLPGPSLHRGPGVPGSTASSGVTSRTSLLRSGENR